MLIAATRSIQRNTLSRSIRSHIRFHSVDLSAELLANLQPAKRDVYGRFPVTAKGPRFRDILLWTLTRKEEEGPRLPKDLAELDRTLPVVKPDFTTPIPIDHARMTWLGHASVLLEVPIENDEKMVVLTDPVFTERCSPTQYIGPVRYRPAPVQVESLPHIDAVLISHNHYDHLDEITLASLYSSQPHIQYFTPLGNGDLLRNAGIPSSQIVEQNWWDSSSFTRSSASFQIGCVPANHWSKRNFFDRNKSLWGGFVVRGLGGSFYFAGDTATGTIFKAIAHKYGEQSVSAIPIGAYSPRALFADQHCNVEEAIEIHKDVRSRSSLGIHWGTWVLTGEYYLEPKEELARLTASDTASPFITVDHGASHLVRWTL